MMIDAVNERDAGDQGQVRVDDRARPRARPSPGRLKMLSVMIAPPSR